MSRTSYYAGINKRFVAMLIDSIFLSFAFFIACGKAPDLENNPKGFIIYGVLTTVISWVYFAGMESSDLQATFGKRILGIVLTDTNGNKISFARATGRHFAKSVFFPILIVAFIIAGMAQVTGGDNSPYWVVAGLVFIIGIIGFLVSIIGYLMAGFTSEKQALHDIIARCLVVNGSGQSTAIPWKIIIGLVIAAILSRGVLAQFPSPPVSQNSAPTPSPNPTISVSPTISPPPPTTSPSTSSETALFGDLVEPNPSAFRYTNGVWKLNFTSQDGISQLEALLSMKDALGIMIVQFYNGQGGTQRIKQDMKLWSSAHGLVIKGENPTDVDTKERVPLSTYAPDNFLIAISSNGSPIFRNYSVDPNNNSPVEFPVNREFLGYPTIGIQMFELNAEVRDKVNQEGNLPFRISRDTGVVIIKVGNDSSADKAGLKPGDIITSINGTKISTSSEVQQVVQSSMLGDRINFEIDRNGENLSLTLRPGCCVKPESSQE